MCKIFVHRDRSFHTFLGIDLSFFLNELFEELIAVPTTQKKKQKTKGWSPPLLIRRFIVTILI